MKNLPHGQNLRHGRVSLTNQIYLVTMVSFGRASVFDDFFAARRVVRIMREQSETSAADTLAFVVMPDHVHWLMQLNGGVGLGEVVRRFKARVSLVMGMGKSVWQRGFHDHALRSEEDVVTVARYVVANPVRAGLVQRIGDYPHWDAIWVGDTEVL